MNVCIYCIADVSVFSFSQDDVFKKTIRQEQYPRSDERLLPMTDRKVDFGRKKVYTCYSNMP